MVWRLFHFTNTQTHKLVARHRTKQTPRSSFARRVLARGRGADFRQASGRRVRATVANRATHSAYDNDSYVGSLQQTVPRVRSFRASQRRAPARHCRRGQPLAAGPLRARASAREPRAPVSRVACAGRGGHLHARVPRVRRAARASPPSTQTSARRPSARRACRARWAKHAGWRVELA